MHFCSQVHYLRCFRWVTPVSLISFWILELTHSICFRPLSLYTIDSASKSILQKNLILISFDLDGHSIGKRRWDIRWHGFASRLELVRFYLCASHFLHIYWDRVGCSSLSLMILPRICVHSISM